jgi:hypothetical protein
MPGGIPKYVRCYDNGGGFPYFCRKCFRFAEAPDVTSKCHTTGCGHKLIGPVTGGSYDRYTVLYIGHYKGRDRRHTQYVAMSSNPYHPQGFGQHGEMDSYNYEGVWPPACGDELPGSNTRRIPFEVLPEDCKRLVIQDYEEIWELSQNPNQPNTCKKSKKN